MRRSRWIRLVPMALFALSLAFLPGSVGAQEKQAPLPFAQHKFLYRTVKISVSQKSLPDILEILAATAHINLVTDGVPDRGASDLTVSGSIREALDQVCARFDCSWSVSRGGIVMLARRFTNPSEHPQVHLKEMQQMFQDIRYALQIVPPEVVASRYGKVLDQLVHSLTDEQLAASRASTLTGAGLDPQQFVWLNTAILNKSFANAVVSMDQWLPLMEGMPQSLLQLKPGLPRPDPKLYPGTAALDDARFPAFDYGYTVRGKDGKLRTFYLLNQSMITEGAGK